MLGLFCEPWEFTFIWNTRGVRNRQAIQSCFFSMCSAMQQNYCSDLQRLEVRALLGKKKGFAFRLQWGWKSRLGCLLLNLHYSFKFGVTGWISISFYLEHILCNNNLKSFLLACSVSLKKKKNTLSATCNTDMKTLCQVHLTAHNFLIADGVLVSLPGWVSVTLTIPICHSARPTEACHLEMSFSIIIQPVFLVCLIGTR